MNKVKIFKKAISFLLLPAMAAGLLCACGAQSEVQPEEPEKEHSFKVEIVELPDDASRFSHFTYAGDGWYAVSNDKTGENIPQQVIDEAAKKKTEVENDGRYDVYTRTLWHIALNGETKQLKRYVPLAEAENAGNWKSFSSVSNFGGMVPDGNGNILSLEYNYMSGSSAPERAADYIKGKNYNEFETAWYLRLIDKASGRIKEEHKIDVAEGIFLSADTMALSDGKIIVAAERENGSCILKIAPDGTVENCIEEAAKAPRIITLNNGKLALWGYETAGIVVKEISTDTLEVNTIASSPDAIDSIHSGYGEMTFCYNSAWKFYGFNVEQGKDELLFAWHDLGLNFENNVSQLSLTEDGAVCFINSAYKNPAGEKKTVIVKLFEESEAELQEGEMPPQKEEMILLTCCPTQSLISEVADYNTANPGLKIKITDISTYCRDLSAASVEAAMKQYIREAPDGTSPDILDLSLMPYFKLSAEGLLQDLYEFIDSDPELDREDLVQGVLSALEYDGRLFSSCSGFTIDTLLAPSSIAGVNSGWSFDDYTAALGRMKAGSTPFDIFITSGDIFEEYIRICVNGFVDWQNGTCSFDSEQFKAILNFAAGFQEQFDSSKYNWENGSTNSDLRINRGEQMLLRTCIYNMRDAIRVGYEYPESVSFKGYPSAYGNGSIFNISSADMPANFAIFSSSSNKEAAWQFIRTFFTAEYQKKSSFFPSNMNVFKEQLEAAMKVEYVVDAQGKPVLGKKTGQPVERSKDTMYLSNFVTVKCYAITQEKADKLMDLISSTKAVSCNNDEICRLVYSAVKDVFSGKISADDAAANAQKVAGIYLDNLYSPAEQLTE